MCTKALTEDWGDKYYWVEPYAGSGGVKAVEVGEWWHEKIVQAETSTE